MELFDYIRTVFSSNEKNWKAVSTSEKRKHFWMLNRYMSIKYPNLVYYLSHYRINSSAVSDYWHRSMSSKFSSPPNWIYAKAIKKQDVEKKLDLPSDAMIKWHCEKNEMSRRDFDENVKMLGKDFLDEIKSLEKILKAQKVI